MAKYLIKTVETYRTDSEAEANDLVEKCKQDPRYEVIKSTIENRTMKLKVKQQMSGNEFPLLKYSQKRKNLLVV